MSTIVAVNCRLSSFERLDTESNGTSWEFETPIQTANALTLLGLPKLLLMQCAALPWQCGSDRRPQENWRAMSGRCGSNSSRLAGRCNDTEDASRFWPILVTVLATRLRTLGASWAYRALKTWTIVNDSGPVSGAAPCASRSTARLRALPPRAIACAHGGRFDHPKPLYCPLSCSVSEHRQHFKIHRGVGTRETERGRLLLLLRW